MPRDAGEDAREPSPNRYPMVQYNNQIAVDQDDSDDVFESAAEEIMVPALPIESI